MILTKKKTQNQSSMEHDRRPGNKPHSYSHLILTLTPKCTLDKRQPLQQKVQGKLVIYIQKSEIRPLPFTLCKKKLIDQDTTIKI
jgi:hypothetical protein